MIKNEWYVVVYLKDGVKIVSESELGEHPNSTKLGPYRRRDDARDVASLVALGWQAAIHYQYPKHEPVHRDGWRSAWRTVVRQERQRMFGEPIGGAV